MESVETVDGTIARVVTESDLLDAERTMKWWLVSIMGVVLMAAFGGGVSYAGLVQAHSENADRIADLRTDGGPPVQQLKTDIAVLISRQDAIVRSLEKIEARLDRARIAPAGAN